MARLASRGARAPAWVWIGLLVIPFALIAQGPFGPGGIAGRLAALEAQVTTLQTAVSALDAENATQADAIAALRAKSVPVGTILTYSAESPPAGYLECDGTVLARADYPELFVVIGTAFGAGDGSTTFHLPNLRGEFLRGWDHGAGRDPDTDGRYSSRDGGASGDHVGSSQFHEVVRHTHPLGSHGPYGIGTGADFVGGAAFLLATPLKPPESVEAVMKPAR